MYYARFATALFKDYETKESSLSKINSFLPMLYWVLRDSGHLRVTVKGQPATRNEYLLHLLSQAETKLGKNEHEVSTGSIRTNFKNNCFMLPKPQKTGDPDEVDILHETYLNPGFVTEIKPLVDDVLKNTQTCFHSKNGKGWLDAAGRLLERINDDGRLGRVGSVGHVLAELQNEETYEEAKATYNKQMQESFIKIQKNSVDISDLTASQRDQVRTAKIIIEEYAFGDKTKWLQKLERYCDDERAKYEKKLHSFSETCCMNAIRDAYAQVAKRVEQNYYHFPGGYKTYQADGVRAKSKYLQQARGPAVWKCIGSFLDTKAAEAQEIKGMDNKLTSEKEEERRAKEHHERIREREMEQRANAKRRELELERRRQAELERQQLERQRQEKEEEKKRKWIEHTHWLQMREHQRKREIENERERLKQEEIMKIIQKQTEEIKIRQDDKRRRIEQGRLQFERELEIKRKTLERERERLVQEENIRMTQKKQEEQKKITAEIIAQYTRQQEALERELQLENERKERQENLRRIQIRNAQIRRRQQEEAALAGGTAGLAFTGAAVGTALGGPVGTVVGVTVVVVAGFLSSLFSID